MSVPGLILTFHDGVARKTRGFVESRAGKILLSALLIGPFTFIPTVWEAWTAPNIDALRTLTWPLMFLVNIAGWLSSAHSRDWRMQAVMIVWAVLMALMFIATLVR